MTLLSNIFGLNPLLSITKPVSLPLIIKPVQPLPLATPPKTVQNLGQEYEYQSYDANGNIVTKTLSLAQIILNGAAGLGAKITNFQPESVSSLSAAAQQSEARLVASLKLSTADVNALIQDSLKLDYMLCIKSQQSLPVDFNFLQTPTLTAQVTYNFFTASETDLSSQEDQTLDPLLTNAPVPRFVQLNWDVVGAAQQTTDVVARTTAEANLASTFFATVRGTATSTNQPTVNSFQKNLAQVPAISRNGQALKLVDTHDLERGFNSTSNARLFKNTATTTINTRAVDYGTIDFKNLILEDL